MEQLTEEKGFDWKGAKKMEVIRAGAQWKEEILRFADRIFGEDVQPGGFAELIPDVYGPEAACDGNHLLVVEDGRIRALLLTEPISFVSGGEILKGIGVGTVSVAEDARGRGFMQLLLKTVREWMTKEGYVFAVLAGQRQRYAYWGYEPMEMKISMHLDAGNGKHGLVRACAAGGKAGGPDAASGEKTPITVTADEGISFAEMEEGSEEEGLAFELFERLPLHTLRQKERFARHLKSGRCIPLVIRENGRFAGYICDSVRNGKHKIAELELADMELYPAVLTAYWKQRAPEGFSVELAPFRIQEFSFLEKVCGSYELCTGHQYYVADLPAMLDFFLRAKQRLTGLSDGEWSFQVEERLYCCSVKGGNIQVTVGAGKKDKGVKEWEKGELVRFLFGPSSAVFGLFGAPAGWFPLPLYLPGADAV